MVVKPQSMPYVPDSPSGSTFKVLDKDGRVRVLWLVKTRLAQARLTTTAQFAQPVFVLLKVCLERSFAIDVKV